MRHISLNGLDYRCECQVLQSRHFTRLSSLIICIAHLQVIYPTIILSAVYETNLAKEQEQSFGETYMEPSQNEFLFVAIFF